MNVFLLAIAIVIEDDSWVTALCISLKLTDVSEMLKMSHSPDDERRNRL
jgi:hypothetical protein